MRSSQTRYLPQIESYLAEKEPKGKRKGKGA